MPTQVFFLVLCSPRCWSSPFKLQSSIGGKQDIYAPWTSNMIEQGIIFVGVVWFGCHLCTPFIHCSWSTTRMPWLYLRWGLLWVVGYSLYGVTMTVTGESLWRSLLIFVFLPFLANDSHDNINTSRAFQVIVRHDVYMASLIYLVDSVKNFATMAANWRFGANQPNMWWDIILRKTASLDSHCYSLVDGGALLGTCITYTFVDTFHAIISHMWICVQNPFLNDSLNHFRLSLVNLISSHSHQLSLWLNIDHTMITSWLFSIYFSAFELLYLNVPRRHFHYIPEIMAALLWGVPVQTTCGSLLLCGVPHFFVVGWGLERRC